MRIYRLQLHPTYSCVVNPESTTPVPSSFHTHPYACDNNVYCTGFVYEKDETEMFWDMHNPNTCYLIILIRDQDGTSIAPTGVNAPPVGFTSYLTGQTEYHPRNIKYFIGFLLFYARVPAKSYIAGQI